VKGRTLKGHIREKMKNPEFAKAWHELDMEFSILENVIRARKRAGMTQIELARRIGTKQPVLSRLEKGGFDKANIETLRKIANALNHELVVKFEPKKNHVPHHP
jgi:ribosome-binding protein aMBF1 (putative translation factor)